MTTKMSSKNSLPVVFHLRIKPDDSGALEPAPQDQDDSMRPDPEPRVSQEVNMNAIFSVIQDHRVSYAPDTHCFWCRHPFEHKPYSQLRSYNVNRDEYVTSGHYCSPQCAVADMDVTAGGYWEAISLMQSVWGVIKPAPSWKLLRAYGGPLDIRQFRQLIMDTRETRTVAVVESHIYPSFVVTIPSVMDKGNQDLRLQRRKPVSLSKTPLP